MKNKAFIIVIVAVIATILVFVGGALDMSKVRMIGLILYGAALCSLFSTNTNNSDNTEDVENNTTQNSLDTNSDDSNNAVANKMSGYSSKQE